ncbi:MAG: hypothetical protein AAB470_02770 [Patescibacteria group bacterium]
MKTRSNPYKTIIGGVVIVGAIVLAFYFLGPSKSTDSLISVQATPEANIASTRILNLLQQIKSLKIDTSIFKDPAYQTLVDYTVEIPAVNVGRPNPFAPIPGFSVTTTGN